MDTAKLMWETLKKRYAVANIPKMHQLKASISNCKQGGLSVVEFYSKISDLWVELGNYEKVPYCTCKGCTCEAANKIVHMYKQEKAHQFLMGLNDDAYSSIRSQILTHDPLPSLDRIFNMVMQEENHKSVMRGREDRSETSTAYAAVAD